MSDSATRQEPSRVLPERFADLEPYADWALATEAERSRKRRESGMDEIRALYNAILPHMPEAIEYLNQLPLDDMPDDARRLYRLTLALAEVAPAVEFYKQPTVVGGFDPERFVPVPVTRPAR